MQQDKRLKDFRNFMYLTWNHLQLPKPNEIQYDIGHQMQLAVQCHLPFKFSPYERLSQEEREKARKTMIEGFRGVAKSYAVGTLVPWVLYWNPKLNISITSASKDKADENSNFIKQLIDTMPVLTHLRPRAGQRDSMVKFDVGPAGISQSPSVKSVGIFGQITGSRADIAIPDDVEIPANAATQALIEKLQKAWQELVGAVLKPGGTVLVLGTPQSEQSIYNDLPRRGYRVHIYPVRYPSQALRDRWNGQLADYLADRLDKDPSLEGKPTNPERFNEAVIREKEAEYARDGFALQFMLDTQLADADRYPLKLSDLVVMSLNTEMAPAEKIVWAAEPKLEWKHEDLPNVGMSGDRLYRPFWYGSREGEDTKPRPYQGALMTIDPSGRGKDETTYTITKILNGQIFLIDAGGFLGGYEQEVLDALAMLARLHKVNTVLAEENMGGGMFTQLFKPVLMKQHRCSIEEVWHSTQKEARIIDTIGPVAQMHKLVVDAGLVKRDYESTKHLPDDVGIKYQLFYQYTRITRERGCLAKDDRLDALAMAVAYWTEQMAVDVDDAVKAHNEEALQDELNKFIEAATGSPLEEHTWISDNGAEL